ETGVGARLGESHGEAAVGVLLDLREPGRAMDVDAHALERETRVGIGLLASYLVDLLHHPGREARDQRRHYQPEDEHDDHQLDQGVTPLATEASTRFRECGPDPHRHDNTSAARACCFSRALIEGSGAEIPPKGDERTNRPAECEREWPSTPVGAIPMS